MSQFFVGTNSGNLPSVVVETLTGNNPVAVGPDASHNINVIGGTGATVTGNAGTNTLTIDVSGGGFTWLDQAISFVAIPNTGNFCTSSLTATLPVSVAVNGQSVIIYADPLTINTAITVVIQAQADQVIDIGNKASSLGGTATNTQSGSNVNLVFRAADKTWHAIGPVGTWTMA